LNVIRHAVEVYCDPDSIPEQFSADLSGLDFNASVRWSDLKGIEGTRPVITGRDFVVATVAPPTKMTDAAEETPAAAAAAPVAAVAAAAPAAAAATRAPAGKGGGRDKGGKDKGKRG
jgi:large subunit ribosomal protein L25